MYGEEAEEMLKQYLFQQVELTFVGGVERYTNAYNCLVRVDSECLNVKLLENGLAWYMGNKEVSSTLSGQLSAAEARGKMARKNLFGSSLPEPEFDSGSFKKMVCRKIVGLSVSVDNICFRFAENQPIVHTSGNEIKEGRVG